MATITLNEKKISELITKHRTYVDQNVTIEVMDDTLILNNKGRMCYVEHLNFECPIENVPENFLHKLVCEHLNLPSQDVICTSMGIDEAVFKIRFAPNKNVGLILCSRPLSKINVKNFIEPEDDEEKFFSENRIGFYHRLGDSSYFFRWDEDYI